MTLLKATRNIVINHRLLYKNEIREIDPDVARHLLALHPDALLDVTPRPIILPELTEVPADALIIDPSAETVAGLVQEAKPRTSRRRKAAG